MKIITTKEVFCVSFPNSDGFNTRFGYFVKMEDAEFVASLHKGAWGETGCVTSYVEKIEAFESLEEAGIDKQAEIDKIKNKLTPAEQRLLGLDKMFLPKKECLHENTHESYMSDSQQVHHYVQCLDCKEYLKSWDEPA